MAKFTACAVDDDVEGGFADEKAQGGKTCGDDTQASFNHGPVEDGGDGDLWLVSRALRVRTGNTNGQDRPWPSGQRL